MPNGSGLSPCYRVGAAVRIGLMIAVSSAASCTSCDRGARWRDCPPEYGPYTTIYNRFNRWSRLGIGSRCLRALTGSTGIIGTVAIVARLYGPYRQFASDTAVIPWELPGLRKITRRSGVGSFATGPVSLAASQPSHQVARPSGSQDASRSLPLLGNRDGFR